METEEQTQQQEEAPDGLAARHGGGRDSATSPTWPMCARALAFGFSVILPMLLVRSLRQTDFGVY